VTRSGKVNNRLYVRLMLAGAAATAGAERWRIICCLHERTGG